MRYTKGVSDQLGLAMRRIFWGKVALLAISSAALLAALEAGGQSSRDCGRQAWFDREAICEVREVTLPAQGTLRVDARQNGGIEVIGSDRRDVLVRALIRVAGEDADTAREIAEQIVILTDGEIRADGPAQNRRANWVVSYEILTPRDTDLDLETTNGGIAVENVRGALEFDATNGGIKLDAVGGDVHGRTVNGGLDIRLTGDTWEGAGLDVATTNGGIRLRTPENYSARLEARTVNGGVDVDFPITVQGRIGREVSTTLGSGGPLLRLRTQNGGVRVTGG